MSIADLDSAGLAPRPGIAMFIPGSGGVGSIPALNDRSFPTLILPGAGGDDAVNPAFFCSKAEHAARFQTIGYPGWRRYVETGFSADGLIEHLAAQIALRAPEGPIRIIGISLGGHLGYAAALHLQASGREIGGFCAIDACMTTSASRYGRMERPCSARSGGIAAGPAPRRVRSISAIPVLARIVPTYGYSARQCDPQNCLLGPPGMDTRG